MPNPILNICRLAPSSDLPSNSIRQVYVSRVHVSRRLESMEDVKVHSKTRLVLCEVFPYNDINACCLQKLLACFCLAPHPRSSWVIPLQAQMFNNVCKRLNRGTRYHRDFRNLGCTSGVSHSPANGLDHHTLKTCKNTYRDAILMQHMLWYDRKRAAKLGAVVAVSVQSW